MFTNTWSSHFLFYTVLNIVYFFTKKFYISRNHNKSFKDQKENHKQKVQLHILENLMLTLKAPNSRKHSGLEKSYGHANNYRLESLTKVLDVASTPPLNFWWSVITWEDWHITEEYKFNHKWNRNMFLLYPKEIKLLSNKKIQ